eukprot:gene16665-22919_t
MVSYLVAVSAKNSHVLVSRKRRMDEAGIRLTETKPGEAPGMKRMKRARARWQMGLALPGGSCSEDQAAVAT